MTFREHLLRCLGGDWPEPCPLEPRITKTEQREGYRLEWVDYAAEPGDRVPAILLLPDGRRRSPPLQAFASGISTMASGISARPNRPGSPATRCTTPASPWRSWLRRPLPRRPLL